ncbi:MAG: class III extradiol ring-cleavage dioxygenase [Pseudomonadota bacterium]
MQPSYYIPHGGGPCFFMDDPAGAWKGMASFLRGLPDAFLVPPRAILVISGHWETTGFTLTSNPRPPLVFDYYGFPAHTYQLRYDAPGAPDLAERAAQLLSSAGLPAQLDPDRGLDHGVFVPLKVALPDAQIPVVEMSLDASLDPELHLAAGRALAPLRDEGVLILGTGMSFHNLRALGDPRVLLPSLQFDSWLNATINAPAPARSLGLTHWHEAPAAHICHPRSEHLLPLMVAAGASQATGQRVYNAQVLGSMISGFRFD